MTPKQKLIDKYNSDGSSGRVNKLLSLSHLLAIEQNNLIQEASDILQEHRLLMGELKMLHTKFENAANDYFNNFGTLIKDDSVRLDMCDDYDSISKIIRSWGKIED